MSIRAVVPALLFLVSQGFPQQLTKDEREILWHQDQRLVADSVLFRYLSDTKPPLRKLATLALGAIQDSASIPFLIPVLNDKSADVREAAAFALGQVGSAQSEDALGERLRSETNPAVLARLLEALGRSGSQKVYDDVVAFGLPKKLSSVKADQALSIARFALRSIKSERGIWFCFDALEEPDTRTRWCALFALWRMAPHGAIDVEVSKRKELLKKLCSDKSADIRMNLATLLGKTRVTDGMELLVLLNKNEARKGRGDWRVQVNVVKACASLAPRNDDAYAPLVSGLSSESEHVRLASLAAMGGLAKEALKKYEGADALRKKLEQFARPSKRNSEIVRGEALVVLARHFPGDFPFMGVLEDAKSSLRMKTKALEALSFIPSAENCTAILERLEDDSLRVAMAAWDYVKRMLSPQSVRVFRRDTVVTNELGLRLFRKAKVSLLREDFALTTLVANALADSSVFSFLKQDGVDSRAVEELMLSYGKLSSPNDAEAMQAILEALGRSGDEKAVPLLERALEDPDRAVGLAAAAALQRSTGGDYAARVASSTKPLYTDYDWKTLAAIPKNQKVTVKTNRGTFTIQLLKDRAPFTVMSFYKLVRRKFYNGLAFHRVVPNFVIQGGDPRGDGWGGPNYAIRSECALVNFDRGAVGVASSGKDTEGCQFFVTHSPQPHLDGRYTIFATVVGGMDVVDKIQIGDSIVSVTFLR